MKVRTAEALFDLMSEDSVWRKRELVIFRRQVDRAKAEGKRALLRASVALLYAHWEGFTKNACYWYLCYVASRRLRTKELQPQLVATSLRSRLEPIVRASKMSAQIEVIRFLRDDGDERAPIPTNREAVRTTSNLSSTVLIEVLVSVGCDPTPYAPYYDLIDEQLVAPRNRIAHGEADFIHVSEWDDLRETIIEIMDDISAQIVNNAVSEAFRLRPAPE